MPHHLTEMSYGNRIFTKGVLGAPYRAKGLEWERSASLDIDGDGDFEILVSSTYTGSLDRTKSAPLLVFDWRGGKLVDISREVFPKAAKQELLRNLVTADFNGDGIDDIFANNFGTEGI